MYVFSKTEGGRKIQTTECQAEEQVQGGISDSLMLFCKQYIRCISSMP